MVVFWIWYKLIGDNTQQSKTIDQVEKSIELSPSISDLVGQLDNVKPQYRFKVMNEIKKRLAKENTKNRANKLNKLNINTIKDNIITTRERMRKTKQSNMKGSNSAMVSSQISLDGAFSEGGEDRGSSDSMSSTVVKNKFNRELKYAFIYTYTILWL